MKVCFLYFILLVTVQLFSQQVADTSYHPSIQHPAYPAGKGPVVFIDQGHYNFHTRTGRYQPFASLLERDGYVVKAFDGAFTEDKLEQGKILVIANALNKINEDDWFLPTPSAFTKEEIEVVKNWVMRGGSLFLIADHMPMGGAAQDLAAVFGFSFNNGFVFHTETEGTGYFNTNDGSLVESTITKGRDKSETVETVVTFTGQGFQIPADATSILTFDENYYALLPDTAWVFTDTTPKINVKGWSQGAYKKFGKGRVVAFGEAAMFSAQLAGPDQRKVGMNSANAPENHRLLLNIIHWLDGLLQD